MVLPVGDEDDEALALRVRTVLQQRERVQKRLSEMRIEHQRKSKSARPASAGCALHYHGVTLCVRAF